MNAKQYTYFKKSDNRLLFFFRLSTLQISKRLNSRLIIYNLIF